jgi:hypothetical protein
MGVKICLLYHGVILLVLSPNDVNLMVFVIVSHIKVVNNRVRVHSMKSCYHAGLCEPGLLFTLLFFKGPAASLLCILLLLLIFFMLTIRFRRRIPFSGVMSVPPLAAVTPMSGVSSRRGRA